MGDTERKTEQAPVAAGDNDGLDKSAAALSELSGEPRTIEWEGLTLTLPDEMQATAAFAWRRFAKSPGFATLIDVAEAVLGEQSVEQIEAKMADDKLPANQLLDKLTEVVRQGFQAHGVAEGESVASASS